MTVVRRDRVNPKKAESFRISKIIGRHEGEDFFVVGSGSSLIGFKYGLVRGLNTIALNDAIKAKNFIPRYHLFSDAHLYNGFLKKGSKSGGTNPSGGYRDWPYHPEIEILCQKRERVSFNKDRGPNWNPVWEFDSSGSALTVKRHDDGLFINRTVATAAIMFAWKMGAKRIFLLGIDGYKLRIGSTDIYYFDGSDKPPEKRQIKAQEYIAPGQVKIIQDRHDFWKKQMQELKRFFVSMGNPYPGNFPGPGVYNLNEHSTIDAWPKVSPVLAISTVRAGV